MIYRKLTTLFTAAILIVAVFAIFLFAGPEHPQTADSGAALAVAHTSTAKTKRADDVVAPPGVEPVRLDLLDAESGSYKSQRNLFAYKEPPPPPTVSSPSPSRLHYSASKATRQR